MYSNLKTTWQSASAEFLLDVQASKAKKTLAFYKAQLTPLMRWAAAHGVSIQNFTARHMRQYLIQRTEDGLSERTRYHDVVTAKRFFTWLATEGLIENNPLARYVAQKCARSHVPQPSVEDLKTLLAAIERRWNIKTHDGARFQSPRQRRFYAARERAIICALVETAARSGEVLGLTLDCYQPAQKQIVFPMTKGKEPRTVPLTQVCVDVMSAYLQVRPECDSPYLFVANTGDKMDVNAFSRLYKRYVVYAAVKMHTPHGLRHYSITELAKEDLWAAVAIAGHKDAKTTAIYARHDPEHLRAAHAAAAPLGKILVEKRQTANAKRKRII